MKKMNPLFRSFLFGIYSTVTLIFVLTLVAKFFLSEKVFLKYIDTYFDYNLPVFLFLLLWIIRYLYLRYKEAEELN